VKSALERAADLLARARFPMFGGLLTDIRGAEAALALAAKLGVVVDHAASTGLMRASRVMRETGATPASFGEVRNRADTVVIVGQGPLQRDPDLLKKLFPAKPGLPRPGDNKREVILFGTGKAAVPKPVRATEIEGRIALPDLVALLAAAVRHGRFDLRDKGLRAKIEAAAERLRKSAFAVFVYDPAELDEPVRLLGLTERGHLGPGAIAYIAVYTEQKNKTAMFSAADLVFKSGKLVVRDGKVVRVTWGRCYHVEPGFDKQIKRRANAFYDRYYGADLSWFGVSDAMNRRPDRFAKNPSLS
jgi:hypothetical protein